ncbi:uncharacterized protein LOC125524487 [Triticum urartu]|uniref:uncharacterized protein LOC125524487 n=1 Tax=Triticum urartu TaxID=4572 RepID=UPI00162C989C|nr:uncharacterized protein LOC125524487 [Triticum urartu]
MTMGLLAGDGGGGGLGYNTSCGKTSGLVWNLTSSYADQSNEASMLSATVIMFLLAALFFNLNLFSGLSDTSAILDPKVRVVLSKALSLFLPVMSYLFSEAKNAGGLACGGAAAPELPLRARLILTWMLLVELLRNKVEEIRMQRGDDGWHRGTVERAGRVVWLGSLVFFNLRGAGRKSVLGILWLLCVAKLVQRVTFTLVGKNSLAYGKNARLIISYMHHVPHHQPLQQQHGDDADHGDELLQRCRYAVMGEDKLVKKPTPAGYSVTSDVTTAPTTTTVGKIWRLAEDDPFLASVDQDGRLRRLCLSFALFKLLRRSFEHLPPMSEAETRDCRSLIFFEGGLYCSSKRSNRSNGQGEDEKAVAAAEELFQVMKDETIFLSEYYHSVVPVALASPFFLLANYLLLPAMVLLLCLVIVVLCGNGDLPFAFHSLRSDNYSVSFGVLRMARCLLTRVLSSPSVFFSTIDLSITLLLFLVLVYEQVWEFVVFLFSNWFLVSMLHGYAAKPRWRRSATFNWAIRRMLWVRSKMSHPDITMRQFSALRSCRLSRQLRMVPAVSLTLPTIPVPKEVKHSIAEYLLLSATSLQEEDDCDPTATRRGLLSNGQLAVAEYAELRRACKSESIAEVILAWHIATCLFEEKFPSPHASPSRDMVVATTLSRYCAYLVAFHPELLPENEESTERVFEIMEEDLRRTVGFWRYHLPAAVAPLLGSGYEQIMRLEERPNLAQALEMAEMSALQRGAILERALEKEAKCAAGVEGMWKVLADLWVQLMVYVAPSGGEEHVMGHAKVLPEGGEFVTVLWALATHTGMRRAAPVAVGSMEHV